MTAAPTRSATGRRGVRSWRGPARRGQPTRRTHDGPRRPPRSALRRTIPGFPRADQPPGDHSHGSTSDSRYPHAVIVRPLIVAGVWLAAVLAAIARPDPERMVGRARSRLDRSRSAGHLGSAADPAHHPAAVSDPRTRQVPDGVDPARDPAVLHRIQYRGRTVRPGDPRPGLRAREGAPRATSRSAPNATSTRSATSSCAIPCGPASPTTSTRGCGSAGRTACSRMTLPYSMFRR